MNPLSTTTYSAVNITTTTTTFFFIATEDAYQQIQWVGGRGQGHHHHHHHSCRSHLMHACMYEPLSVKWWLASGMHANAFHMIVCEPWLMIGACRL